MWSLENKKVPKNKKP